MKTGTLVFDDQSRFKVTEIDTSETSVTYGDRDSFTFEKHGNTLYPDANQASIAEAILTSWEYGRQSYLNYPLQEDVNYPSFLGDPEAWPRSESMATLAVELPPGETVIEEPLYLPANISLRGAGGSFDGSILRFRGMGSLIILGDLQAAFGTVKPFGKTIRDIYFVAERSVACVSLLGNNQNLRISNCHFNTKGNIDMVTFHHERMREYPVTPFGKCFGGPNPHCKEIMFSHCQFEFSKSGGQGIHLIGPQRCRITDTAFIYGQLGVGATEAMDLRISSCDFTGGLFCPAVIETTDPPHNRIYFEGNTMTECGQGAWVFGMDSEGVTDANNQFKGRFSSEAFNVRSKGDVLPFQAGGFDKGKKVG